MAVSDQGLEAPIGDKFSEKKRCYVCGNDYPANNCHWFRDKTTRDGWENKCKRCSNELRKQRAEKESCREPNPDELSDREQAIREMDRSQLEQYAARIDDELISFVEFVNRHSLADLRREGIPGVGEVYGKITEKIGGAEGLSRLFIAQYLAMEPGSSGRTSLLKKLLDTAKDADAAGVTTVMVQHMATEDIEAEVERRRTALQERIGKIINVDFKKIGQNDERA